MTFASSGWRLDSESASVWSPEAVRQVSDYLRANSQPSDEVASGAVIWEWQADRRPFARLSHPLALLARTPSALATLSASLREQLATHPPRFIVMDGYTQLTYGAQVAQLPAGPGQSLCLAPDGDGLRLSRPNLRAAGVTLNGERVLFVTRPLEWGGSEKHLLELILRADPAEVSPTIVALAPNLFSESLQQKGRTDVPVRLAQGSTFREFRRIFAEIRPTVIVFVNGKLGLFPCRAYAAARWSGARRVVGVEHLQAGPAPPPASPRGSGGPLRTLLGWRARYMYGRRRQGICLTQPCASARSAPYPDRRIFLSGRPSLHGSERRGYQYYRRSGAPRVATRAALGLPEDSEIILYVARLSPIKRIDILIRRCLCSGDIGLRSGVCLWVAGSRSRNSRRKRRPLDARNDRVRRSPR